MNDNFPVVEAEAINEYPKPIVQMVGIVKNFGAVEALRGMSLDVYSGEAVGLVGDNGAGKSTLVKVLCGAHKPTDGEMFLEGRPLSFESPHEARLDGIEIVYQDLAVVGNLDVTRNVFLGRERTKKLFGVLPFLDCKRMAQETKRLMEVLDPGLTNRTGSMVENLSGGQRQSVAIARSILYNPKVLIFDEPTAALSADKIQRVLDKVKQFKNQGMAIIYISHRLQDILEVCDRVVIMKAGRLVKILPITECSIPRIVRLMVAGHEDD
jgi:simple sugar transport system ATP-binding protein